MVGNEHDAWRAVIEWAACPCGCEDHEIWMHDEDPRRTKRIVGSGESRCAWLVNGVIYKIGRASANEYEHRLLTAWRDAGGAWAPETTLFHFGGDQSSYGYTETVIAMTYLPDDGTPVNEADLAEIRRIAPQTWSGNYTTHRSRTYLIDGQDIETYPEES